MPAVPDPPPPRPSNLPARRLSTPEVEAVIRRAVELQGHAADAPGIGGEGMSEAELIRIGKEIGIAPQYLQRALAETSIDAGGGDGWFGRGFGPAEVRASRLIRQPADAVRRALDSYLRDRECMIVERRFPDRVVYAKSAGVTAALQRAANQLSGRYPLLDLRRLELAIHPVDEHSCYVSATTGLHGQRAGLALGGLASGGGAGGAVATAFAIAVAPPAALVGVPIFIGSLLGMRAIYRHNLTKQQDRLESLLDRVEHGELSSPDARTWRRRLGM